MAVLGLVACNAFFVFGEYSIVTARRTRLLAEAEEGSRSAAAVLRLMDDPVRVMSTVQVGITAIGILIGAIGEPLTGSLLGEGIPNWVGFLVVFALMTYLSVVLGELVPKALTLQHAESLAKLIARPIELIGTLWRPIVWLLQGSARLVLRPFGVREVVVSDTVSSAEELRVVVDGAEEAGAILQAQEELFYKVLEFAGRQAQDVMIPATEVVWLDAGRPVSEAVDRVLETPHRHLPAGVGSLDRLIGAVHAHEILKAAAAGSTATVGELTERIPIVPETKDLGALLREMREQRCQIVAVVSEYGTTMGILAMEDILEELVGDIRDDYELLDRAIDWIDARTLTASGWIALEAFNETTDADLPVDGPRTLGGLVLKSLGRRPRVGDTVQAAGTELTVEEMDGARVARLRVSLPERPDPAAGE
jgi:putative hemolysin